MHTQRTKVYSLSANREHAQVIAYANLEFEYANIFFMYAAAWFTEDIFQGQFNHNLNKKNPKTNQRNNDK